MSKEEWGTKRLCPSTGRKFYDLNHNPVISPYTGEEIDLEPEEHRLEASVITKRRAEKHVDLDDDLVTDDDLDESGAVEDDDLLEEDDDETISLDDLADVPNADKEDS